MNSTLINRSLFLSLHRLLSLSFLLLMDLPHALLVQFRVLGLDFGFAVFGIASSSGSLEYHVSIGNLMRGTGRGTYVSSTFIFLAGETPSSNME
jgi:hypothetical protein